MLLLLLFLLLSAGVEAMNRCKTEGVWVEKQTKYNSNPGTNPDSYSWRLATNDPSSKHGKQGAAVHSTGFLTEEKALEYAPFFRWYYYESRTDKGTNIIYILLLFYLIN